MCGAKYMKERRLYSCKDADCGEKFFWDFQYDENTSEWTPIGGRIFCPFCDGENLKQTQIKYPLGDGVEPAYCDVDYEVSEEKIELHQYQCPECMRKFYLEEDCEDVVCPYHCEVTHE